MLTYTKRIKRQSLDSSYVVHTGEGVWEVENGWCLKDHNWRRGGYMDLNLARALEVSSNIGRGTVC